MESECPDLSSDDEVDEEQWQEMETSDVDTKCLFCGKSFDNFEKAFQHTQVQHNFDLIALKQRFNMDCYSYIKLINFIRTHNPTSEQIMSSKDELWSGDFYLKPVLSDEWLMYDFESLTSEEVKQSLDNERQIIELKRQLQEKEDLIKLASEDIEKMKKSMQHVIDGKNGHCEDTEIVNCASKVSLEDDEGYFNTYAHFGIHYQMLSDKVRTESYKNAIIGNSETFKGKTVLDLGCGTGILSMFSASAGAKKVYAIDQSDIVYHAIDIIRENKLDNVIQVVKGKLEKTPLEKVDIIVSEWMGYFLVYEGMLDSVIYARDHLLNPNGLLLPNRCNISIVANGDVKTHLEFIDYWSDVYGYKMNCMKSEVVKEASVDVVNNEFILSKPFVVTEIDINTCSIDFMNFQSDFELEILKDGSLTSIVGYFDTFFDLPVDVSFSTGPQTTPTHWKQTIFYFKKCTAVKKGDILKGKMLCSRKKNDVRALAVQIEIFGKNHEFILS